MRKSVREAIEAAEAALSRKIDDVVRRVVTGIAPDIQQLAKEAAAIQPASVDLTQEMADDIVRKIHGPLTISKEFSRFVAEQGKFHDAFYVFQVGYGSDAGRGEIRMKGDGSMHLQFRDMNGADLWRGTFVPPDFGVSDDPG